MTSEINLDVLEYVVGGIKKKDIQFVEEMAHSFKYTYHLDLNMAIKVARESIRTSEYYGVISRWNDVTIQYMIDHWNEF